MIKKQQKWIALLVTLTFMWLLQVSAMPLTAANAQEQVSSANAEQAPRFVEEEGDSGYRAKKSSALPLILGLVAVGAIAVLVLVVLKTSYDITGTWAIAFVATNTTKNWTWTVTCTGDKKKGTFSDNYGDTGTYTVDGKNVTWKFDDFDITGTGTFSDKDKMSGNATFINVQIGGVTVTAATWTATRTAATAAIANPLASGEKKARK